MIYFYRVDQSNRIIETGARSREELDEAMADNSLIHEGYADPNLHYFDGVEIQDKSENPCCCAGLIDLTKGQTITVTDLPPSAEVFAFGGWISKPPQPSETSAVVGFGLPGVYTIQIWAPRHKTKTLQVEVKGYAEMRRDSYPPLGDQLDAIWKILRGESDPSGMRDLIAQIKQAYPKQEA